MDKDVVAAFVEKYGHHAAGCSPFDDEHCAPGCTRKNMIADLAALLAAEREAFKDVFIWRDGEPYYYTRNGMPMEIPERIIRKIKAAIRADRTTP